MSNKIRYILGKIWHSWLVWVIVAVLGILQWYYWPRSLAQELGKISPEIVSWHEKILNEEAQTDSLIYYGYVTPDVLIQIDNTPITVGRFWENVKETTVWRRSREDFFSNEPAAEVTLSRYFFQIYTDESCDLWIYITDRDVIYVHGSYKNGRAIERSWVDISHSVYRSLYEEAFQE